MVRDGWKYLRDDKGKEYLFHLREDIGEQTNLASRQPERLSRMKLGYEAWREEVFRDAPAGPARVG